MAGTRNCTISSISKYTLVVQICPIDRLHQRFRSIKVTINLYVMSTCELAFFGVLEFYNLYITYLGRKQTRHRNAGRQTNCHWHWCEPKWYMISGSKIQWNKCQPNYTRRVHGETCSFRRNIAFFLVNVFAKHVESFRYTIHGTPCKQVREKTEVNELNCCWFFFQMKIFLAIDLVETVWKHIFGVK